MLDLLQQKNQNKLLVWLKNPRNLVVAGLVIVGIIALVSLGLNQSRKVLGTSEEKPTVSINRSYSIVARTQDKKTTDGKFTLVVTNAQISDSILVQGKVARPIKGKAFLVINMEIENSYKIALYSFPVDLFRFVRSDGQKFAPSVHQGTVEVRPQATKKSNVAFVVAPTDKKFTIEVGEIGKDKQTLQITFR